MNFETEIKTSEAKEIIVLLQENNNYLKQMVDFKRKEQRHALIHLLVTVIPWMVVLLLGYFIWQSVMHYLDALNNNINILKGNFDTLAGFIQKITPDFGTIVPKLQNTWENIKTWK